MSKYQERLVSFIDILGWSSHVSASASDDGLTEKLVDAISAINRLTLSYYKGSRHDIVDRFSDSVIYSSNISCEADILLFFANISYLQRQLGKIGFFIRGGVSFGKMWHEQGACFGPALNEAVSLEQCEARYPRIILSQDALNIVPSWSSRYSDDERTAGLFRSMHYSPNFDYNIIDAMEEGNDLVLIDRDGIGFINYFFGAEKKDLCDVYQNALYEREKWKGNQWVSRKYSWVLDFIDDYAHRMPLSSYERRQ